jgi:hypothetical protein
MIVYENRISQVAARQRENLNRQVAKCAKRKYMGGPLKPAHDGD